MPEIFRGYCADDVWRQSYAALTDPDLASIISSRSGPVREILQAVLHVENPRCRWVTSRQPAMNLAFAIAEVVWIIRGRQDSEFLTRWNSSLCNYVGHSPTLHGAYGFRLRNHFGTDQLKRAADALLNNRDSRQVVLQIWDAAIDLPESDGAPRNQDIPCNVLSMLKIRSGKLEWSQVMRSNDVFRGLPYNVVQFTLLQEILAGWIGVDLGSYTHFSDSLHMYVSDESRIETAGFPSTPDKSLALPESESEQAFQMLEALMDLLSSQAVNLNSFDDMIESYSYNDSFRDLAAILVSETARRKNQFENCLLALEKCSNQVLKDLAKQWFRDRKKKPDMLDQPGEPSDLALTL